MVDWYDGVVAVKSTRQRFRKKASKTANCRIVCCTRLMEGGRDDKENVITLVALHTSLKVGRGDFSC